MIQGMTMNAAFYRSDAIDTLEEISFVLLVHLSLLVVFPKDRAGNHWKAEVDAFVKTLQRYNKGKKGRLNYVDARFVIKILHEKLDDEDERQRIETHIRSKGYDIEDRSIDWKKVKASVSKEAQRIF